MSIESGNSWTKTPAVLVAAGVLCAGNVRAQVIDAPGEERPAPKAPVSGSDLSPGLQEIPGVQGQVVTPDGTAVGTVRFIGDERTPYQQELDGLWDACADAYILSDFEIGALLREVTGRAFRVLEPHRFQNSPVESASVSKVLACNEGAGGKPSPSTEEVAKCVADESKNNPRSGFRNDTFASLITRSFQRPQATSELESDIEHCIPGLRRREQQRAALFEMRERFGTHVDNALKLYRRDLSPDVLNGRFGAVKGKGKKKK